MHAVHTVLALAVASSFALADQDQTGSSKVIGADSKVFIAKMDDDFHEYLKAAMQKKRVPITVVENRPDAQFEITGHSETQKAGTAKKLLMGSWRSNEQASIQVANLETGEVVFAYSVNKKAQHMANGAQRKPAPNILRRRLTRGSKGIRNVD